MEKNDAVVEQKIDSPEFGISIAQTWKSEVFENFNNKKVISIYPAGVSNRLIYHYTFLKDRVIVSLFVT